MFRLPDSRLNNPGAGLASALIDERGGLTWGSISLTDDVPLPPMVAPGEWSFESTDTSFILAFGLRWANPVEGDQTYTLLIIEDRATFRRQVAGFRRTLWSWLAVAAIGLLSVQGAILAWGLGPLRRLRRDLRLVEKGKQTALGGRYPQELVPLSEAINGMISTGQAQLERHRHALGDLAHSLKTPLAVLRGMSEDERLNAELRQQIAEPLAASRIGTVAPRGHGRPPHAHRAGRAARGDRKAQPNHRKGLSQQGTALRARHSPLPQGADRWR